MKKGLVIASGEIKDKSLIKRLVETMDWVVCADGGIEYVLDLKIKVDALVGDLDSVSNETLKTVSFMDIEIIKYPIEKDKTDTELSIDYLVDKGCESITLVGVTGGRMDHTLSHVFILKRLEEKNIKARIVDDQNVIYYTDNMLTLPKQADMYVSIIPLSFEGIVVSLTGFYYPLDHALVPFGSTLTNSNRIVESEGIIRIEKGAALIIESKDTLLFI